VADCPNLPGDVALYQAETSCCLSSADITGTFQTANARSKEERSRATRNIENQRHSMRVRTRCHAGRGCVKKHWGARLGDKIGLPRAHRRKGRNGWYTWTLMNVRTPFFKAVFFSEDGDCHTPLETTASVLPPMKNKSWDFLSKQGRTAF
jgi:hypothetical protein